MKIEQRTMLIEECRKDALNYNSRTEWAEGSGRTQRLSKKLGVYENCCKHMLRSAHRASKFDLKICEADAARFATKNEWKLNSEAIYNASLRLPGRESCIAHMPERETIWNEETCGADALKFDHKSEWKFHSPGAVSAARKLGIYGKCTAHMSRKRAWTFEKIEAIAAGFSSYKSFKANAKKAYRAAYEQGVLEQCCKHMRDFRQNKKRANNDAKPSLSNLTDALLEHDVADSLENSFTRSSPKDLTYRGSETFNEEESKLSRAC